MIAGRAADTVLFDLDGTFADTLPDLADALGEALATWQIEPVSEDILRPLVSHGARAMAERACSGLVDDATLDRVLRQFLALYAANVARRTRLVAGMPALLDGLDGRGITWGIVTNKRREFTEPLMAVLDPQRRAACIVSGDTTANAKPHPQPLLHACRLASSRPADCVYVGDAENDVIAARRAGMRSVVALYGYLAPEDDARRWRADATIEAPGELLALLDAR